MTVRGRRLPRPPSFSCSHTQPEHGPKPRYASRWLRNAGQSNPLPANAFPLAAPAFNCQRKVWLGR